MSYVLIFDNVTSPNISPLVICTIDKFNGIKTVNAASLNTFNTTYLFVLF